MARAFNRRWALYGGSVFALSLAGGAPVMSAQGEPAVVLDEVEISAPRGQSPARDVPMARTVLSGEQLSDEGIARPEDLQQRVPGLLVSAPNPRFVSYGIRGLGTSSFNDGLDPSVGLYVDGVYLGRQGMSLFDLNDVERVEVLRGPQGTLYGKNTTAGAVNVITRQPTFEPEGKAEVSLGQDGLRHYRASVSGALVDNVLAGRLSGYDVERDGILTNLYDGSEVRDQKRQGLRGQLLWLPSDTFSARLIGEYGWQDDSNMLTTSNYSPSTYKRAAYVGYTLLPVSPYSSKVLQDQPNSMKVLQTGASLELNQTLGNGAILTSITGYRDWRFDTSLDGDGLSLSIGNATAQFDQHQFSQELRLADSPNERLDYVVGLYYLRQQFNRQINTRFGADAAAFFLGDQKQITDLGIPSSMIPSYLLEGTEQSLDGEQRSDSRAVFGQFTWHLTPRLDITPGLRYTTERKQGTVSRRVSGRPVLKPDLISQIGGKPLLDAVLGEKDHIYRRDSVEEHNLSGQLAVSYRLNESTLGYVSWARGYKGGGINLDVIGPNSPPTFGAEHASSLELGLKNSFWNERLLLDLTLYQTDVDGYQVLVSSPPVNELTPPMRDSLINIDKVRLRGVEMDGLWRASDNTDLRLGIALNDARYRDFRDAPCEPGNVRQRCDRSGERLFSAPQWSGSAGIDQRYPLGLGLEAFSGLDYSFRSGYYGSVEGGEGSYQPGYGLTNMRLGLRRHDRQWETELWARNLFNTRYITAVSAQLAGGDYAVLTGDPRSVGVTLRAAY